jgi:hypothetical protein
VRDALISNMAVRIVVLGALVMVAAAVATYVGLRLRTTYSLDYRITALQHEVETLAAQLKAMDRDITIRVSVLERVIYGQALPEIADVQNTPTPVEVWQRNRDRLLRERLDRLERWRLDHQEKH